MKSMGRRRGTALRAFFAWSELRGFARRRAEAKIFRQILWEGQWM
jgi:hypothetical protein